MGRLGGNAGEGREGREGRWGICSHVFLEARDVVYARILSRGITMDFVRNK
jgi:hypothetical protein